MKVEVKRGLTDPTVVTITPSQLHNDDDSDLVAKHNLDSIDDDVIHRLESTLKSSSRSSSGFASKGTGKETRSELSEEADEGMNDINQEIEAVLDAMIFQRTMRRLRGDGN